MVNLRRLDNVILVSLSTMEYEEKTEIDTSPELYTFELSAVFMKFLKKVLKRMLKKI